VGQVVLAARATVRNTVSEAMRSMFTIVGIESALYFKWGLSVGPSHHDGDVERYGLHIVR